MNRSRSMFLSRLLLAAGLLLVSGVAHSQFAPPGVDPRHYWTYRLLDPVFQPTPLLVRDQFYRQDLPVTVDSLTRLVNWVSKNGSPVLPDTLLHYTWWNIREKVPTPRAVRVTNQFGSYPVNVVNLEFMLVPAWKNQPQPAFPVANHYLCYRAFGFLPPPQIYTLLDEWRQDQQAPGPMEYLCNPCQKNRQGQIFPPVDTLTHLALYPIQPQSSVFIPQIFDQFFQGPRPVQQRPVEYLLVPSSKLDLATPTKRGSWGKLKTVYR